MNEDDNDTNLNTTFIYDENEKINEIYKEFEKNFEIKKNTLIQQMNEMQNHLKEIIDNYCLEKLPSVIPEEIIQLAEDELNQYMNECDKIIGNEIDKLKDIQNIDFNELITINKNDLKINDDNKSIELFEKAIQSTNELLDLLK